MEENKNILKSQDVSMLPSQLVDDVKLIVERGLHEAYQSVNMISIMTYWNVGKRIVEEEQQGETRAEYGTYLMKGLAEIFQPLYGSSYSLRNLQYMRQFYLSFRDLEIVNTRVHNLSW